MKPYSSDPFRDNQRAASQSLSHLVRDGGQRTPSQFAAQPTPSNTGLNTIMKASMSMAKRQQESRERQVSRQQDRMRKATPTQISHLDTLIKPDEVNRSPTKKSGSDYLIRDNGEIHVRRTQNKFDRFYLEHSVRNDVSKKLAIRQYKLVATFVENEFGYIPLPDIFEANTFAFRYTGSANENYIAANALAALLGALNRAGFCDVSFNHWSNADGSTPKPSRSHKLGTVGDIRPLRIDRSGKPVLTSDKQFDTERNSRLIGAFRLYGWNSVLSERNANTKYITPGTTHYNGYRDKNGKWHPVRHNNHYHIQRFKPHLTK